MKKGEKVFLGILPIAILMYISASVLLLSADAFILGSKDNQFSGIPKVKLSISDINNDENLIYAGIDVAVFSDKNGDGNYTVVEDDRKVKRFITRDTTIELNLGSLRDYQKGVSHKLAYRTLFVPIGVNNQPIIIADEDNGSDGWKEVPNTYFTPSYFINENTPNNSYIKHTNKWNENIKKYNILKNRLLQKSKIRDENVFWAGEKLKLHIELAERIEKVQAVIYDKVDAAVLYETEMNRFDNHETYDGGVVCEGELYDISMYDRWGNEKPDEITVLLKAIGDGGKVLEEKKCKIIMDNKEKYYEIQKGF